MAFQSAIDAKLGYHQSNVFRYHDTFPHPAEVPYWPETFPTRPRRSSRRLTQGGRDLR